jgi:hypothetical protein
MAIGPDETKQKQYKTSHIFNSNISYKSTYVKDESLKVRSTEESL